MSTYVLTDSWTMTRRELAHWARQPVEVLVGLAFPVMLLLMFGHLIGGGRDVEGAYIAFLVPGMLALTMAFGLDATMTAVTQDLGKGVIDRFRVAADGGLGGTGRPQRRGSAPVGAEPDRDDRCRLRDRLALERRIRCAARRLGPAAPAALRDAVARHPSGDGGGQTAAGAGRADPDLACRFPLQRVRHARVDAGLAGHGGRVEPLSATATSVRELSGIAAGSGSWAAEHAQLLALAWPLLLVAVFFPLAVRRFVRLSH